MSFIPVLRNVFNPTAELVMLFEMSTKVAKQEVGTHPVSAKAKLSRFLISFKVVQTFLFSYLSIHFGLFIQRIYSLFCMYFPI